MEGISTFKINQKRDKNLRVKELLKVKNPGYSQAFHRESSYYDEALQDTQVVKLIEF